MKKIILTGLFILFAGLGLNLAGPVVASFPGVQFSKCRNLKADPKNQLSEPEFYARIDGSRITVGGTLEGTAGVITPDLEWSIDLQNCSYRAKTVQGKIEPRFGGSRINQEQQQEQINPELLSESGLPSVPDVAFRVGFTIITKDPLLFWLASTKNHLYWQSISGGKVQWTSWSKGCTGYTTPANTHWYVTTCSYANPIYRNNQQEVISNIFGNYHNFDFNDAALRTDAEHFSEITGFHNGAFRHTWSTTHSGDASWLLIGSRRRDF